MKYGFMMMKTLVIKSTVPPRTCDDVVRPMAEDFGLVPGEDVGIVMNPEFLREGYAWNDFMNPDRIVIGTIDHKSADTMAEIYSKFDSTIHVVESTTTAEFIKYASNTLLSTLISFSNELSMIADHVGDVDIKKTFEVLIQDRRWYGEPAPMISYLLPGCGFGGYCLPKDTEALINLSIHVGHEPVMLRSVMNINNKISEHLVQKVLDAFPLDQPIGILGLAFKANSDDVRSTPAALFIQQLLNNGYHHIYAYDPMAIDKFRETYDFPIVYNESMKELCDLVNHVIILTGWGEFREKRELLSRHQVFDFRYIL